MANKKAVGFILEKDQKEIIDELDNEEAGIIFKAIYEYETSKQIPKLNKALRIVFKQFKVKLDFYDKKYNETCEKNRENAEKRWQKHKDTHEYERIQSDAMDTNKSKENKIKENKSKNNIKESKKERTEQSSETGYDFIISQFVSNEKIKEALYDFLKMRKMIKKPMTDRALKQLINKLLTMSNNEGTQLEILDQSIINNWSNIYPLKEENKNKKIIKIETEPEWFNKDIKKEEATEEEQQEMKEMLEKYK